MISYSSVNEDRRTDGEGEDLKPLIEPLDQQQINSGSIEENRSQLAVETGKLEARNDQHNGPPAEEAALETALEVPLDLSVQSKPISVQLSSKVGAPIFASGYEESSGEDHASNTSESESNNGPKVVSADAEQADAEDENRFYIDWKVVFCFVLFCFVFLLRNGTIS